MLEVNLQARSEHNSIDRDNRDSITFVFYTVQYYRGPNYCNNRRFASKGTCSALKSAEIVSEHFTRAKLRLISEVWSRTRARLLI